MTFEEFAEAMQKEGFYREDIEARAAGTSPTIFTRPLTGSVYCPRGVDPLACSPRPNGDRRQSPMWTGHEEALRMAKAREV